MAALEAGDVDIIEYVPWQNYGGDREATRKLAARRGRRAVHVPEVQRASRGRSPTPSCARRWPMRSAATTWSRRRSSAAARRWTGLPLPQGLAVLRRGAADALEDRSRQGASSCSPRAASPTASRARCSRPRSTACTRTPPRSCSRASRRSACRCELRAARLGDARRRSATAASTSSRVHGHGRRLQRSRCDVASSSTAARPRSYARSLRLQQPEASTSCSPRAAPSSTSPSARRSTARWRRSRSRTRRWSALAWRSQGYAHAEDASRASRTCPGSLTFYSGLTLEDTSSSLPA